LNIAIKTLKKAGLKSIGICSTLWVDKDGVLIAGLFLYHESLHLAVKLRSDQYWITPVSRESVEKCLRGKIKLSRLAGNYALSFIYKNNSLQKALFIHQLLLSVVLKITPPILIPNYYYVWNDYCFKNNIQAFH